MARMDAPPSELERIGFDVALTESLVRYLSDLRFGRTAERDRPRFHPVEGDADLAVIVRDRLARAGDVGSVVETLEPPFARYRRTLHALESYLDIAIRNDGQPRHRGRRDSRTPRRWCRPRTVAGR